MNLTLKIILIVLLLVIAYQDFKHRAVWWLLFPIAFIVQAIIGVKSISIEFFGMSSFTNLLILLIQLAVLYIYFWLTRKRKIAIINNYLGLGDLLFFLVLTIAFSTINFILFEITMLFLSLIVSLFLKNNKQVPLAGIMTLGYAIVLLISHFIPTFNPFTDIISLYQ